MPNFLTYLSNVGDLSHDALGRVGTAMMIPNTVTGTQKYFNLFHSQI